MTSDVTRVRGATPSEDPRGERVDEADEVELLLSTCDGAHFLPALLESLARQTHECWRLLARDDDSKDGSLALLEEFAALGERPVTLLRVPLRRLGACASYAALLDVSSAPYVALCDQDDVWDADKLAISLEVMHALEARYGAEAPLLVHSDLRVTDHTLRPIDDSLWHHMGLDPKVAERFERVLIHNVVTGCATLANRALVELARPVPAEAVMHDWWLALVASAFGHVGAIDRPTLLYRQHGSNVAGAERFGWDEVLARAGRPFDRRRLLDNTAATGAQARGFLERFESRMSVSQREAAHALAGLLERGFVGRRWAIVRNGLYKAGWLRNLATLLRI